MIRNVCISPKVAETREVMMVLIKKKGNNGLEIILWLRLAAVKLQSPPVAGPGWLGRRCQIGQNWESANCEVYLVKEAYKEDTSKMDKSNTMIAWKVITPGTDD